MDVSDAEAALALKMDISDTERELALKMDVSDAEAALALKMDVSDAEAALADRPDRDEVASGFSGWTVVPPDAGGRVLSVARVGGEWHLLADGTSVGSPSAAPADAVALDFTVVSSGSPVSVHASRLRYAPSRVSQLPNDAGYLVDGDLSQVRSRLETLERQPEYAKARADWSESDESDASFILNRPDIAGMIRAAVSPLESDSDPLVRMARAARSVETLSPAVVSVPAGISAPSAIAAYSDDASPAALFDTGLTQADPGRVWWKGETDSTLGGETKRLGLYIALDVATGEAVWCVRRTDGGVDGLPFAWASRWGTAGVGSVASLAGAGAALRGGGDVSLAFGRPSTEGEGADAVPSFAADTEDSDWVSYLDTAVDDVAVQMPSAALYPVVYMDDLERLVGGAPEALDTLRELADLLAGSDSDAPASVLSRIAALEARTVDSALSATSENPVRNKAVTEALDAKLSRSEAETGFTEWTCVPAMTSGQYAISVEQSTGEGGWRPRYADGEGTGVQKGDGSSTSLSWSADEWMGGVPLTATRTRLPTMADIPTKTSDLTNDGSDGEHPFISQHQQLEPVYSQTPTYGNDWTYEGLDEGLTVTRSPEYHEAYGPAPAHWDLTIFDGTQGFSIEDYNSGATASTLHFGESGAITATRVRTDIIGYTLGDQTTKPLQPQGNYYQKPSSGIPKADLASAVQTSLGLADTALQSHQSLAGLIPKYSFDDAILEREFGETDYTFVAEPYTITKYTATSTAIAFSVAIGLGVTGKARDCILVIDCTVTGAVAPTVTWGTHFHPRTDVATDLAIVEAGKRAVFYISEYAEGEFAVGGWVETVGGSGT